jgi:hypothetical protein
MVSILGGFSPGERCPADIFAPVTKPAAGRIRSCGFGNRERGVVRRGHRRRSITPLLTPPVHRLQHDSFLGMALLFW